MTFSWLVVPNSIGLIMSMLQLCLLAAYPSLSLQKNGYENDDMMGRRIKESYVVLIDNGVVVEEVDSSLRWGDGECLLDMDSGPKCSTDLTTSGFLFDRGLISHTYVYSMIDSCGGKSYIFN
jgi:hypothetical protein